MPPSFIETIRIENGEVVDLERHQTRFDSTRAEFFPGARRLLLADVLPSDFPRIGRVKWRVLYGETVEDSRAESYVPRKIRTLRIVEADFDYARKSADRRELDACFARRGNADEVLISRNGMLTDATFANVALEIGGRLLTPRRPLLKGTCRERLLRAGTITEADLSAADAFRAERVAIFNAMLPLGEILLPASAMLEA